MRTTAGKLFSTFYALYSGLAFLSMVAIILAPVLHRFMHRFHLDESDLEEERKSRKRNRKSRKRNKD